MDLGQGWSIKLPARYSITFGTPAVPAQSAPPQYELWLYLDLQVGWLASTFPPPGAACGDAEDALRRNGFASVEDAARALLPTHEFIAGDGIIKLPPGLPDDAIDEYVRNYRALFGDEHLDPRDAAGADRRHHCAYEGHVWVDTGMLRSWCRWCSEDAEWSRKLGKYVARHAMKDRSYDA